MFYVRDCGWQGTARDSSGGFTWDTTTIPSGIPALSTFVHNLGLRFGVYSDAYDHFSIFIYRPNTLNT